MTRRNFLKKSLGGGALLAAAGRTARAQGRPVLSLASADMAAAGALATRIDTVTGGSLAIEATGAAAEEQTRLYDRVASGALDMAILPPRHLTARSLAFGMFDAMPFGLSSGEMDGWLSASDGAEMLASLSDGSGVSVRLVADGGALPLWSRGPLDTGEKLRRLAVGARGLGLHCLRAAGVRGATDLDDPSVDWASLDVIGGAGVLEMRDRGLADGFTHVARVNPLAPTSFSVLIANDAARAALTRPQRDLLETACAAQLALSRGRAFHENTAALLEGETPPTRFDIGDDAWRVLQDGSQALLAQIFESGDREAAVVDAYVYFVADIAPWSEIGEAAYYSGRKRVLTGL